MRTKSCTELWTVYIIWNNLIKWSSGSGECKAKCSTLMLDGDSVGQSLDQYTKVDSVCLSSGESVCILVAFKPGVGTVLHYNFTTMWSHTLVCNHCRVKIRSLIWFDLLIHWGDVVCLTFDFFLKKPSPWLWLLSTLFSGVMIIFAPMGSLNPPLSFCVTLTHCGPPAYELRPVIGRNGGHGLSLAMFQQHENTHKYTHTDTQTS